MSELRLIGSARVRRDRLYQDLPAVVDVIRRAGRALTVAEIRDGLPVDDVASRDWYATERRCWRLVQAGQLRAVPKGRGYRFELVAG